MKVLDELERFQEVAPKNKSLRDQILTETLQEQISEELFERDYTTYE